MLRAKTIQDRTSVTEFMQRVHVEIEKARDKFPSSFAVMTALTEEVGEVAKACLDESRERVYDECIQVAAMACRLATEGDSSLNRYRRQRGQEAFPG